MRGEITYLGLTTGFTQAEYSFERNYKKRNGKPAREVIFNGFIFTLDSDAAALRFMQEKLIIDKQFKDRDKPNPLPADVYKTFTIKIFDSVGYPIRYIELIDAHIRFSRERFKASPKKNDEQTAV